MPFEITTTETLLRITVHSQVTSKDLTDLYDAMQQMEAEREISPDRLTDLSAVMHVDLDFEKMESFASKRRAAPLKNNVRSAIVAPKPLQYGFARMFQTLNDNPKIEISLFQDAETALRWLGAGASGAPSAVVSRIT